jgi:hypothetical protein
LFVPFAWITGNSGVGKSTACAILRDSGHLAFDADDEGFSRWVGRTTGEVVADPPYPVPAGWLDQFGWEIDRARVEGLAELARERRLFLFGSVENEADVRDLFDVIVCVLVDDDQILRDRLVNRTANAFGQNPEELRAALQWNPRMRSVYGRLGAIFVDGTQPPERVAAEIANALPGVRSDR